MSNKIFSKKCKKTIRVNFNEISNMYKIPSKLFE